MERRVLEYQVGFTLRIAVPNALYRISGQNLSSEAREDSTRQIIENLIRLGWKSLDIDPNENCVTIVPDSFEVKESSNQVIKEE